VVRRPDRRVASYPYGDDYGCLCPRGRALFLGNSTNFAPGIASAMNRGSSNVCKPVAPVHHDPIADWLAHARQ
jgi:hypothetical protein